MTLFDPGAPPPDSTPISYTRKLTIWRNEALARGVHPITRRPLLNNGKTCGDCDRCGTQGGTAGRYFKCALNMTRGQKTDLRVGWPACDRFIERELTA